MLAPILKISDIDKFCDILSNITIHNFTVKGVPMGEELTLMPLF